MIQNELTFLRDSAFSIIPIACSHYFLAATSVVLSLSNIAYGCYVADLLRVAVTRSQQFAQICVCSKDSTFSDHDGIAITVRDVIPVILVITILLLSETVHIFSYMFSNWTKVALLHAYTKHPSWQNFWAFNWSIEFLFRRRAISNMLKSMIWDDRMGQNSK